MKITLALVVLLVIFAMVIVSLKKRQKPDQSNAASARSPMTKRRLLTDREQAMYNRLRSTLPWVHVFPQVSFAALLTTRSRAGRNYFDRKIADFVLCNAALEPIAVIELDDATHKGKEIRDASRDALLKEAGYRVVRYSNVADADRLKADFPQLI